MLPRKVTGDPGSWRLSRGQFLKGSREVTLVARISSSFNGDKASGLRSDIEFPDRLRLSSGDSSSVQISSTLHLKRLSSRSFFWLPS